MKYVVVLEDEDGYVDCAGVFDTLLEAYGRALLALVDGMDLDHYFITAPVTTEGENGKVMNLVEKDTGKMPGWRAIVLAHNPEEWHDVPGQI